MSGELIEIYGLKVPADTPRIAVELQAYRENITPEQGGLGAEAHFRNAFKLMWPKYEMSEWVNEIISAWCNFREIIIIGHQRASKSYTVAFCCYLDYCADPNNTLTSLATVTFEGLKLRMWADLLRAVETSEVKFPMACRTSTNELRVYPSSAKTESAEKFQIHGIAVRENKGAQGRIRGGHAPRRRIVLDEAQDIDDPIYEAMVNPMSAPDAKGVFLSNPVEVLSKFGERCEPKDGWSSVNAETRKYITKKGGICLHFDGLKSPNIVQKKKKYTGLLTQANIDEVRMQHGEDSMQWWALIRGWFPPDGIVARIFPASTIERAKPTIRFSFRPEPCATLDPAFEHDNCALHFGNMGRLSNGSLCINGEETEVIKTKVGPGEIPKDYQIARQVIDLCKKRGVKPENFIMDKSGGGRGVFAILQVEWSPLVQGIEYGGAATERDIKFGGPKAREAVEKFVSELWFRARHAIEDGLIGGLENLDPRTIDDLTARRYDVKQKTEGMVQIAEKKEDMKGRLGRSPDFGDAFVQFGELLARRGVMPGQQGAGGGTGDVWAAQRSRARKVNRKYAETVSG